MLSVHYLSLFTSVTQNVRSFKSLSAAKLSLMVNTLSADVNILPGLRLVQVSLIPNVIIRTNMDSSFSSVGITVMWNIHHL